MKQRFKQGERVIIHSLGSSHGNAEYPATVCGITAEYAEFDSYIVCPDDASFHRNGEFTHLAITEACLKRISQ